jgi:hypothetical protein
MCVCASSLRLRCHFSRKNVMELSGTPAESKPRPRTNRTSRRPGGRFALCDPACPTSILDNQSSLRLERPSDLGNNPAIVDHPIVRPKKMLGHHGVESPVGDRKLHSTSPDGASTEALGCLKQIVADIQVYHADRLPKTRTDEITQHATASGQMQYQHLRSRRRSLPAGRNLSQNIKSVLIVAS